MPKTLELIELQCDPTLTASELDWWVRVWREAELVEPEPAPPDPVERRAAEVVAESRRRLREDVG